MSDTETRARPLDKNRVLVFLLPLTFGENLYLAPLTRDPPPPQLASHSVRLSGSLTLSTLFFPLLISTEKGGHLTVPDQSILGLEWSLTGFPVIKLISFLKRDSHF